MEWVLPIETKLGERLGDGSTRDGGKSMAEVSAKINIDDLENDRSFWMVVSL